MKLSALLFSLLFAGFIGFSGLIYVPTNKSLILIANWGASKPADKVLADPGEIGIQKDVLGTGYHWLMPLKWKTEMVSLFYISPKEIGIVTAKFGKKVQGNRFLAEDGEVGIRKRVLGPGTYRINPYGFEIRKIAKTEIPLGSVGVLINLEKGGVETGYVLSAGTHYINNKQYKVEVVAVGVNEFTLSSESDLQISDAMLRGEVQPANEIEQTLHSVSGGAVTFPSKDGFMVGLDVTVVWELRPEDTVRAVDTFGSIDALMDRVIKPKLNSASRNEGSNYTAKEMIQGDSRAKFKDSFMATLTEYTKSAPLNLVAALPRRVYVPVKIQLPIMQAQLKKEEMLTNQELEETSKIEAKLEVQKKLVIQEIEQVKADTRVLLASIRAETEKEVGEFEAETRLMVSKIELDVQKIETKIKNIRSMADAEVISFRGEKESALKKSYVDAFGGPTEYARYLLAQKALSVDGVDVEIVHSGEGTLWMNSPQTATAATEADLMQKVFLQRIQSLEKAVKQLK